MRRNHAGDGVVSLTKTFRFLFVFLVRPLASAHRRNILEKYFVGGMSLMGGGRAPAGMLTLDKKEAVALLNLVRSQR